jgi:hypothetical protein
MDFRATNLTPFLPLRYGLKTVREFTEALPPEMRTLNSIYNTHRFKKSWKVNAKIIE